MHTRQGASWSRRGLLSAGMSSLGMSSLGLLSLGALPDKPSRKLILVIANGGWDVTYCLDPKEPSDEVDGPGSEPEDPSDVESVATFGPFSIQVNPYRRPSVEGLFSTYADRLCVINGLWVGSISHFEARTRVITGTDDREAPDLATIAGVVSGSHKPVVSIDLSSLGRVGPYADRTANYGRKGQLTGVVNPARRLPRPGEPGPRGASLDRADRLALHAFLAERLQRSPLQERPNGPPLLLAQQEAIARAERLLETDIPVGSADTLQDQMLLALELLEAGVCHTVTVGTPSFDSHNQGDQQHVRWDDLCGAIGSLMQHMEIHEVRDTTVAVLSEFGRTPRRNAQGGTDHFPHTSALLFGAGIAGGLLIGGTDERVQSLPIDPVTGRPDPQGELLRPSSLVAGLLETLGVDPGDWLPGVPPLRAFQR